MQSKCGKSFSHIFKAQNFHKTNAHHFDNKTLYNLEFNLLSQQRQKKQFLNFIFLGRMQPMISDFGHLDLTKILYYLQSLLFQLHQILSIYQSMIKGYFLPFLICCSFSGNLYYEKFFRFLGCDGRSVVSYENINVDQINQLCNEGFGKVKYC